MAPCAYAPRCHLTILATNMTLRRNASFLVKGVRPSRLPLAVSLVRRAARRRRIRRERMNRLGALQLAHSHGLDRILWGD